MCMPCDWVTWAELKTVTVPGQFHYLEAQSAWSRQSEALGFVWRTSVALATWKNNNLTSHCDVVMENYDDGDMVLLW